MGWEKSVGKVQSPNFRLQTILGLRMGTDRQEGSGSAGGDRLPSIHKIRDNCIVMFLSGYLIIAS
jgi:hypothetical protein